jgi:thiol-disulfide isomerase/thioredoxin
MSKVIIAIAILLVLGAGILFLTQGDSGANKQSAPASFLELSFTDFEGRSVSLADFAGKPLVVNSWAVWCPFCVKELSDFSLLQKEFPDLVVVAIDRAEPLATAKEYTDNLGITHDMVFLLDPADSFYKSIGGFSMPETVFVDKNGILKDHKRGPMDLKEMKERAEKIL